MIEGLICSVEYGQTSKQYSSIGKHLLFTTCSKTSSDADLPSLLNNAFADLKI